MFQEDKQSASDEQPYPFSITSTSFGTQHPLYRDLSALPRSAAPDFVASSTSLTTSPDVYRSIEQPSSAGGGLFTESSWTTVSSNSLANHDYGGLNMKQTSKELMMPSQPSFTPSEYWNDPYSAVQPHHFDKTKSIEDLNSPLIESFPASNTSVTNTNAPPLPEYIDPCYHFYSKTAAPELFTTVMSSMKRNGVDAEPKMEKFRIKCKTYPGGSLLYFVVRVYRDVKKAESVIECQRRTGDVLRFAELYRTLKKHVESGVSAPTSTATAVSTNTRKDLEVNQEHTQETTQCLLLMASSHFVDVKSKAVEALANMSSQDRSVQEIMIKSGSVNVLLEGCTKFDKVEDVHRPSLTALANLSDGRVDVCRTIAEKSLRCLSTYTNNDNSPQVVRECARVLTNIGHHVKDTAMRETEVVSAAVKNLARSSDPQTLQCARELEDCMGL